MLLVVKSASLPLPSVFFSPREAKNLIFSKSFDCTAVLLSSSMTNSCSIKDTLDDFSLNNKLFLQSFCINWEAISKTTQSNYPFNLEFSGTLVSKTKAFPIKFGSIFVRKIFLRDWFSAVDLGLNQPFEIYNRSRPTIPNILQSS